MNKKTKIIFILLGLLLLAGLLWWLWPSEPASGPGDQSLPPGEQSTIAPAGELVDVLIQTDGTVNLSPYNAVPVGDNVYSARLSEQQIEELAQDPSVLSVEIVPSPSTGGEGAQPAEQEEGSSANALFAYKEKPGGKSGYLARVIFDDGKLNPYPTAISTATVQIVDSAGNPLSVNGAMWIRIGYGYEIDEFTGRMKNASFSSSAEGAVVGAPQGRWELKSDGSNQLVFVSTETAAFPSSFGETTDVLIKNGRGQFSYQVGEPAQITDKLTFSLTGYEVPFYPPRDPQYTVKDYAGQTRSNEPIEVWRERTSSPTGYSVYPYQRTLGGVPGTYYTDPIQTAVTVEFDVYQNALAPAAPRSQESEADYYYQVSAFPAELGGVAGRKFAITITPQPKPGRLLPQNINEEVSIEALRAYGFFEGKVISAQPIVFTDAILAHPNVAGSTVGRDGNFIPRATKRSRSDLYDEIISNIQPGLFMGPQCDRIDCEAYNERARQKRLDLPSLMAKLASYWDPEILIEAQELRAKFADEDEFRMALREWVVDKAEGFGKEYKQIYLNVTSSEPVTVELKETGEPSVLPYVTLELRAKAVGKQITASTVFSIPIPSILPK